MSAADFLAMHHDGRRGFVLPNAWDAGSARVLEHVGFPVLATTSAGIAFAHGRPDGSMTGDDMLAAVAAIVDAVSCPVTADLEAGYDDVVSTVRRAREIGVVGCNIEDQDPATGALFPPDVAAERVAAARQPDLVLNARIDAYLVGVADPFAATVDRARRYLDAGADCIFVPGVDDHDVIAALVAAIDAPINLVAGLTGHDSDAATLRALGVARISVGGSLGRAALGFVERAGRDLLERGVFDHARDAIAHGDLQRRFS